MKSTCTGSKSHIPDSEKTTKQNKQTRNNNENEITETPTPLLLRSVESLVSNWVLHVDRIVVFQIAQCGAIPILVKMLQNAKGDEEKLSACNTLWTLAFDEDNKKEINNDDYVIFELKKLLTSENSQIKRAAAGALWECEGKEKHEEEKQHSDRLQPATGAHARESDTRTFVKNNVHFVTLLNYRVINLSCFMIAIQTKLNTSGG